MQERKSILLHLPANMVDSLRAIKDIRSKREGRRVTWSELFDEATEAFIHEAKKTLSELEVEARGGHGE